MGEQHQVVECKHDYALASFTSMCAPLLSTTFFGPTSWYAYLAQHQDVYVEACESYQKQSYRNRCRIAAPNGIQQLTIPVEASHDTVLNIKDVRLSSHGEWPRKHWNALKTAYGESPFFIYYADDIHALLHQQHKFLWDFNMQIIHTLCQLIDIHPIIHETKSYEHTPTQFTDYRNMIHPKQQTVSRQPQMSPYYQVFAQRLGFIPNLSILDLLFNMGPESILTLINKIPS